MKRLLAVVGVLAGLVAALAMPAGADPVSAGSASAYAMSVSIGGSEAVPPTPADVEVTLPPGGDVSDTAIPVDAAPLAFNGTLNASASVHPASDIPTALTVVEQEVEGPYNAQGVALIEGLEVLLDAAGEGVSLVSAAVIRAEAVAVCRGGAVSYSANSEIVDLAIGGEDIPLNGPVSDLIDAIGTVLDESGLNAAVDVSRNVVTEVEGGGIAVDALVISIAGDAIANITIGHAEVSAGTCDLPECSDTVDNADAEDVLADAADPGCHTDGDATNAATYVPLDDDETHAIAATLPRTGGSLGAGLWLASALGALAVGAQRLRRRVVAG